MFGDYDSGCGSGIQAFVCGDTWFVYVYSLFYLLFYL